MNAGAEQRIAGEMLGEIRAGREPADAVVDAMRKITLDHAEHLRELGPVRVMALDPCPRCGGTVIASTEDARCRSGCGWSYQRLGATT